MDLDALQLTEADQDIYKNFNIVISERWQQEIADTIFELVNQDTDKHEMKKRTKLKAKIDDEKGRPGSSLREARVEGPV